MVIFEYVSEISHPSLIPRIFTVVSIHHDLILDVFLPLRGHRKGSITWATALFYDAMAVAEAQIQDWVMLKWELEGGFHHDM